MRPIDRDRLTSALPRIAAIATGLFAGGLVLISTSVVGHWQQLPPDAFLGSFRGLSVQIGGPMRVLDLVATVATVATVVVTRQKRHRRWRWRLAAAIALLATIGMFFVYFLPTNDALQRGAVDVTAATSTLATWARVQWVRTAVGLFAFVASVHALTMREGDR